MEAKWKVQAKAAGPRRRSIIAPVRFLLSSGRGLSGQSDMLLFSAGAFMCVCVRALIDRL